MQKLGAALEHGRTLTAAVMRYLLAVRLAPILAVHQRLLYGSENMLWDRVGEAMGEEWRSAQAAALSIGGESFEESCAAAFRLFAIAAETVRPLLDERQLAVLRQGLAVG